MTPKFYKGTVYYFGESWEVKLDPRSTGRVHATQEELSDLELFCRVRTPPCTWVWDGPRVCGAFGYRVGSYLRCTPEGCSICEGGWSVYF